jgi:hypothetical protein
MKNQKNLYVLIFIIIAVIIVSGVIYNNNIKETTLNTQSIEYLDPMCFPDDPNLLCKEPYYLDGYFY